MWHNGYTPRAGGYCFNAIFPEQKFAVVVLSNGAGFQGQPEKMVKATFEAEFPGLARPEVEAGLVDSPAVRELALSMFSQFSNGAVNRSLFTPQMDAAMTADVLARTKTAFAVLGEPERVTLQKKEGREGGTMYTYGASFAAGDLRIVMFLDQQGRLAAIA